MNEYNLTWDESLKLIMCGINVEIKKENEELYLIWHDDYNCIINEITYEKTGLNEICEDWKNSKWKESTITYVNIIKFRGMDINKNWHKGLISNLPNKYGIIEAGWYMSNKLGAPFAFNIREETIGKFSGFLDRNGNEIYEGDICDCGNIVSFHKGTFLLGIEWLRDICELNYNDRPLIIGNVFENPELIID